jgi:hypothetical protein
MPLKRTQHWATRELHDFLLARASQPFAWGTNDCCMFAADAVCSFTGVDLGADFRGKYSDAASARAAIKAIAGGRTVEDAVAWSAKNHSLDELPGPLYAQRGDLVLVEDDAIGDVDLGPLVAGVVHLSGRHVAVVGERGLKRLPISNIRRGWRI